MDEKKKVAADYLIFLLKTVLLETTPREKPDEIMYEDIFELSKFHCVSCMTYYAIEQLKKQPEPGLKQKWKNERDRNITKSLNQLTERNMIIENLTSKGIAVLPLKGCLLKEMYSQFDYREMADLDILIDVDKADLARKQMELLGYTTVHFDVSNHDNYQKSPFMGVELHRKMISEQYEMYDYYRDVWSKAIPDDGKEHCFHLSWDDYYMFMLVHFAKHYYGGGSGIRSIMDIHVFLDKHKQELDQKYLKQELCSLGLLEFKETAESLAEFWFGNGLPTEKTEEMAEYVITSGVYGTSQRRIKNKIKSVEKKSQSIWKGKVIYFFSRVFLPCKEMCVLFPLLKKAPVFLPVCWVIRLLSAIIHKRDRVRMELSIIANHDKGKNDERKIF